jgi:hypothetical protein
MNVEQVTEVFGWMLVINGVLFLLGLVKITLFKKQTKSICDFIFGDQSDAVYQSVPRIVFHYEILIVVFNLVPYAALKIVF